MSYNAADITELDDVQHTRLRPAVNLGLDVLNTALRELVDNAVEEVADPSHGGSTVTITLHALPGASTGLAMSLLVNLTVAALLLAFFLLIAWLAVTAPLSKSLQPIAPPRHGWDGAGAPARSCATPAIRR